MDVSRVVQDLDEVCAELDRAANALLDAAESGLAALDAAPTRLDEVRQALEAVLADSSFGDLCGQRLARSRAALLGHADLRPDAHLLAGPAGEEGLDQDSADRLCAATG